MKLVIDSSILIDHLRGGSKFDLFLTKQRINESRLFIPTIVIFELFSGKSTKKTSIIHEISDLLRYFQRIDLNESIAKKAGELYRDIGSHIDPVDYIIAASALEIGGTVVTLNKKHFAQIQNLPIYPIS